ncbi:MAG TPA: hypothetical protein DCS08_00485 [Candidatus Moranbacteria bacterium]|nr:hypothetical protein [Candidatus Moranbacteria bacterium]HBY10827.1 hypothetical protein [Candidatus Moranbacteria bacterium]
MIGPASAFRLQPGESFNFLWKDSEDCVWYQMITPFSKASGLLTDCSDSRGCKYTFQGDMQPKSVTAVLYTGNSPNVYDGTLKDNSKPCGNVPCDNVVKVVPAPVAQQVAPTPAPVVATSVAVAKTPTVKRPKTKKCDPCMEIVKVQDRVGEATLEEKASGLGDLHKKQTKQLKVIGEPKKEGETIFTKLEKIESLVTPPPLPKYTPPPSKNLWQKTLDIWWAWLLLIFLGVMLYHLGSRRRRQP